jgi:S-adenosylmethionine:tRNA ribosyltransferase-isomerase
VQTKDFSFNLPDELIAQYPSEQRGNDKLLLLEKNKDIDNSVSHYTMEDLISLIDSNTLMVFNNSKVRRSRVFAQKKGSEKQAEFLFITELESNSSNCVWKVMVKNAKKHKPDSIYVFLDGSEAVLIDNECDHGTEFRTLGFYQKITESWFETNGHIPLPPYIKRADNAQDSERYQNVYAKETGSAACPTAGLHFTESMLGSLAKKGIDTAYVTLHVGLGTFLPVRAEKIEEHKMHEEFYSISEETSQKIMKAKKEGKKILAVGTTSVRTLESAWDSENAVLKSGMSSTSIFIYPGYTFKVIDQLFTNFHTPESTLLMLVSAFAGKDKIMNAYSKAVEQRYRFFSYGDAMLIR